MKQSLDSILCGFNPSVPARKVSVKDGRPISIWVTQEYKDRYDEIQARSGKQFGKKLREILQAAIDSVDL